MVGDSSWAQLTNVVPWVALEQNSKQRPYPYDRSREGMDEENPKKHPIPEENRKKAPKSCKGCLYFSSNARNPLCVGIARSLPQGLFPSSLLFSSLCITVWIVILSLIPFLFATSLLVILCVYSWWLLFASILFTVFACACYANYTFSWGKIPHTPSAVPCWIF